MTPAPPEGHVIDRVHVFPVRVYYEDTDAGGIVYHATYLRYAERARAECLRVLDWPHRRVLAETGTGFAVRSLSVEYLAPARLDDALVVATRLDALHGASMDMTQEIRRDDLTLAVLRLRLVLLKPTGRPARVPQALRQSFSSLLARQESASDPCQSIQ